MSHTQSMMLHPGSGTGSSHNSCNVSEGAGQEGTTMRHEGAGQEGTTMPP